MAKTGAQWLAEQIFPTFLSGLAARWLVVKLVNILKEQGLVPRKLERWMFHPLRRKKLEKAEEAVEKVTSSAQDTRKEVVASLYQQVPWEDRALFIEAVYTLTENTNDSNIRATGHAILKWFRSAVNIPDVEELDDIEEEDLEDFIRSVLQKEGEERTAATSSPRKGKYPKGINPDAEDIWDEVVEDFSKEIKTLGQGSNKREWAAAIVIFQRLAEDMDEEPWEPGIKPLTPHPGKSKKKRKKLVKKLEKAYIAGAQRLGKISKFIRGNSDTKLGSSSRMLLLSPAEWRRSSDEYIVRFFQRLDMSNVHSKQRKKLRDKVRKEWRFEKAVRNTMSYVDKRYRFRIVLEKESKDEWRLYLTFPLSEAEAILLTGQRNKDSILRKLARLGKKWRRTGSIPEA